VKELRIPNSECRIRDRSQFFIRNLAFGILLLALATPLLAGSQVVATKAALATSSPAATAIGLRVLQSGGTAADAAVAVAFALGVAQPHAGGMGGGGLATYYDAKSKGVWTLDFREVSPDAVKRDMFATKSARIGPISAGVPGMVAGLAALQERFGKKSWGELLAPAIALARGGVKADNDVGAAILGARSERLIDQFKATSQLLIRNGKPVVAGDVLVQGDLAATMERLAQKGASDFYSGEIAKRLIDAVREAGGILSDRDLRNYKAEWRGAMRIGFRGYDICAPPPPSSGGFLIAEALAILSTFDLDGSAKSLHLLAEAERRASIDADKYLGDPILVRIPYRELLSDERAKNWRASINVARATPNVSLVEPAAIDAAESPHTTHVSIVDAFGNAVALTLTLDDDFGGGFVIPGLGFALNDALHDFTTNTNGLGPGRRPMSSMTPLIVLKSNKPFLAAGSTGGATIPTTLLQLLLNVLVLKRPLTEAVDATRIHQDSRVEELVVERDRAQRDVVAALAAMGHGVREGEAIGNVAAVLISDKIVAVADSRHGGAAGGY